MLAIVHLGSVTYVGGTFTQVMDHSGNVLARSNLAAFDAAGNATSWAPSANGAVDALTTDGTRIYAGGAFTQINGKGHHGVVAIGTDGSLPTWSGKATGGAVQALALSGSTLYLVWQHQRAESVDLNDLRLGRDLSGLFASPARNIVAVKMSYWLNP